MPGSTPATSQLDWLISTTAMIVLSRSKATRDLLKSFGWGIRALHLLPAATIWCHLLGACLIPSRWWRERIRTCMGLFLSSGGFWFFAGSLFGAGKPFFVPSPAIRFAE